MWLASKSLQYDININISSIVCYHTISNPECITVLQGYTTLDCYNIQNILDSVIIIFLNKFCIE